MVFEACASKIELRAYYSYATITIQQINRFRDETESLSQNAFVFERVTHNSLKNIGAEGLR
jgi:hypothetical protein